MERATLHTMQTGWRRQACLAACLLIGRHAFPQDPAPSPEITEILAKVQAGALSQAEAEVRVLLRSASGPASGRASFLLGYVLFREHRYTDSLAAYTTGARSATPAAGDLVVVASDYIQLRAYADAVRWLTLATERAPADATAWYLLGRSEYLLDHPDRALAAFEQCRRLHPDDLPARYNAGLALERLQRPQEAEAAYRDAIALAVQQKSTDPQPWLDLGSLLLAQARTEEAIPLLRTAVEKAPDNPSCRQQLGVALESAGQYAEAVEALRRAVQLAPGAERAHFYLARTLKQMGRKAESDAEFAVVAQLHGGRSGAETPNPDAPPPNGGEKIHRKD